MELGARRNAAERLKVAGISWSLSDPSRKLGCGWLVARRVRKSRSGVHAACRLGLSGGDADSTFLRTKLDTQAEEFGAVGSLRRAEDAASGVDRISGLFGDNGGSDLVCAPTGRRQICTSLCGHLQCRVVGADQGLDGKSRTVVAMDRCFAH